MPSDFVPAQPKIVSVEPVTFFKQHGAQVNGTEDLSGLPNGDSVVIQIFDMSTGNNLTHPAVPVNSDGTWQATFGCTAGHQAFAFASLIDTAGNPGTTSSPTDRFTLP
ncbi:hypothetical protein [Martelella sp. FOR1707]